MTIELDSIERHLNTALRRSVKRRSEPLEIWGLSFSFIRHGNRYGWIIVMDAFLENIETVYNHPGKSGATVTVRELVEWGRG